MSMHTNERGFIALMSVVIIAAILLVMMSSLGIGVFLSRFDVLESENKRVGLGLAEACMNAVMLKLAQDPHYAPPIAGECVNVGDTCGAANATRVCRICSVSSGGFPKTITTRAVYKGAYSNVRIILDNPTPGIFPILSWREEPIGTTGCVVP